MFGSYLGPEYSSLDIERVAKKYSAKYEMFNDDNLLQKQVAELLSGDSIVGWMQGRMEFGPRALGARSILGDPSNKETQKKLNSNHQNLDSRNSGL